MSDTPSPPVGSELSPLKRAFLALEAARARIKELESGEREPIAIIGMGCRIPGGVDSPESFWQLMHDGVDAIGPVPASRWDADALYDANPDVPGRIATKSGGFLDQIDGFDPAVFGIAPREAATMDPQQRLLLEVAWEALERAGIAPDALERSATGVYVGVTASDYAYLQLKSRDDALLDAHFTSGIAHSIHSGRLSYLLGLQGPSLTLDTACSSSLVAVHLACSALRNAECRMAIAGGVNLLLSPDLTIALSRSRMLAPDGRCKTFSASADGFARGEGCAVVVLKRLSEAQADGDPILAVIRGSAVNQDGASSSLTAPNGPAQETVLRDALARAGVSPRDVSYVEAHGTGTELGDPIEMRALGAVFGEGRDAAHPLVVGSVKTNVGHLEAAAGLAGLLKVVLALGKRTIPKHLHFDAPSPHIAWDELPIVVPGQEMAWKAINGRRIAGVSSFGFSGTNAHIVLEEAPAVTPPAHVESTERSIARRSISLFPISAADEGALRDLARRTSESLEGRSDDALASVCLTAGVARAQLAHRAVILASTMEELRDRLSALAGGRECTGVRTAYLARRDPARAVFMFTGQGAQYAGMARSLYEQLPVFKNALDRCAEIVAPHLPVPLIDLLWGSASARLDETAFTQPALVAVEWALAEVWRSWGVAPMAVIGHSVGEYVGAVLAGIMSLEDALALVAARGRLMQALPAGGAMSAIAADEETVKTAVAPYAATVAIAGVNAPDQTVISGVAADVATIASAFAARSVRVRPLTVSHAFHSPLLDPMLDEFERAVATKDFSAPRMRIVSNLTGQMAGPGELAIPRYWRRHAREAVRFADGVRALAALRPELCVEVGPHPALSSPAEPVFSSIGAALVPTLRKGRDDLEQMLDSAGMLWLRGATLDWRGVYAATGAIRTTLPTYPWQHARYWFDARKLSETGATAPRGRASGHPLLGTRIRSASRDVVFESRLSASEPTWVGAHRVQGHVIMPATAYLETMRAAGEQALGARAVTVTNVTVREAMILAENTPLAMQVVVADGGAERTARCFTLRDDDDARGVWTEHASATLAASSGGVIEAPSLKSVQSRCDAVVSADEFYTDLARRGLDFGSAFRSVSRLARGDSEAVARIELDDATAADVASYGIHPVLLDGCLQAVAAAMPRATSGADEDSLFLPIGVASFTLRGSVGATCWSHATVRGSGATRNADVTVYDETGNVVAALRGVALTRASAGALARLGDRWLDDALYEVAWPSAPTPLAPDPTREPALDAALDPAALARIAEASVSNLALETALDRYDDLQSRLEELSAEYVERAFVRLGWSPTVGERVDSDALRTRLHVLPRHARLFSRLLAIAGDAGMLRRDGDAWIVARAPRNGDMESRRAELAQAWGGDSPELEMTARTAQYLAEALRGEVDPHQLLFPGGSTDNAERMYRDAAPARVMNGIVAAAIAAAAKAAAPGRPLRILEIGGGTGGTTAHLAPLLPADRVSYTFTDVGALFVARARERFSSLGYMRFDVLDLEREPEVQGFAAGAYDVVVATNVIHATADLRRTLTRVKRLLAPGGVLAMLEVTAPQRWFDLTVGLTDGWWAFTDTDLRADYATMPTRQWLSLFEEMGFDGVASVPAVVRTPAAGSLSRQALLLARTPSIGSSTRDWIIVADAAGTADMLAATLRGRGDRCTIARSGSSYSFSNDEATIDLRAATDVQRLLADCRAARRVIDGIVHAASLDVAPWETTDAKSLRESQTAGVSNALLFAQAVLAAPAPAPKLWFVTRGAQQADERDTALDPAHATVWGLGAAIGREHPELGAVCVDLDPASPGNDVQSLIAELDAAEAHGAHIEPRVAHRGGERRVARLRRLAPRRPDSPTEPWRLERDPGGSLDLLRPSTLSANSLVAPGIGEVEIAVHATGLNFKDVLNALGMYPGNPGPLGGECAGVVTRVGHGVTHVRSGDRVMAVGGGSFASQLVTRATLVQPLPDGMSMAEGAAFPIAYLTAHFCLDHLAKVGPGDRVLIHAAAGGVGMAAVRLAQRAGAEVIATAGSEWKRDVVRALGVTHVFDSRSPAFAEDINRVTNGRGVDVVLNSLAGQMLDASFRVLARGGRFVEIGKRDIRTHAQVAAQDSTAKYFVVDWGETEANDPELVGTMLSSLVAEMNVGRLRPLPRHVFPADQVQRAFRFMAQARHVGRIVVEHAPAVDRTLVRGDGTYLVTGGLSGLGLVVAKWLGERGAGRVVLVSRRGVTPDAESAIAELRAAGVSVVAEALDVSDERALDALLARIRTDGPPLRGVIHSAGALDDAGLLSQNAEKFEHVFAAKVRGAYLLDKLTRPDALDWFVAFSSVAAVLGSRGQANHSAANAFLDLLARERQTRGLPGLSINWGAWSDTGAAVDRGAADRLEAQGLSAVSPVQGMQALTRLLGTASVAQAMVLPADWRRFMASGLAVPTALLSDLGAAHGPPQSAHPSGNGKLENANGTGARGQSVRELLAETPAARRRAVVLAFVRERALRALGLDTSRSLDPRTPLGDLGLDSLLSVELRNTLATAFGSALPATLLFDYPTIDTLTDHLMHDVLGEARPDDSTAVAPPPHTAAPTSALVSSIESLSDDDVDRLLASRSKRK